MGPKTQKAETFLGIQYAVSEQLSLEGMEQYFEHGALNTETDWHL